MAINGYWLIRRNMKLSDFDKLIVKQRFEGFELLGYETRNKYEILDENQNKIGFAAEQQKGIFGWFMRQYFGHWRKYDVHFFDEFKKEFMFAHHPFRWIFQRFEIKDKEGKHIGALQQRFSILTKRFDILDKDENVILEMKSPFWKIWTFPFYYQGQEVSRIEKKWTGLLAEAFTDKDTFMVSYPHKNLTQEERLIILASSIFVDLQYFEKKAN